MISRKLVNSQVYLIFLMQLHFLQMVKELLLDHLINLLNYIILQLQQLHLHHLHQNSIPRLSAVRAIHLLIRFLCLDLLWPRSTSDSRLPSWALPPASAHFSLDLLFLKHHNSDVFLIGMDYLESSKQLLTASWDKTVKLHSVNPAAAQKHIQTIATYTGHPKRANEVQIPPFPLGFTPPSCPPCTRPCLDLQEVHPTLLVLPNHVVSQEST